jgi:hypothetical protein
MLIVLLWLLLSMCNYAFAVWGLEDVARRRRRLQAEGMVPGSTLDLASRRALWRELAYLALAGTFTIIGVVAIVAPGRGIGGYIILIGLLSANGIRAGEALMMRMAGRAVDARALADAWAAQNDDEHPGCPAPEENGGS